MAEWGECPAGRLTIYQKLVSLGHLLLGYMNRRTNSVLL